MSRREAFESQERDALQPLPDAPYAPATWKRYRVIERTSASGVRVRVFSGLRGAGALQVVLRGEGEREGEFLKLLESHLVPVFEVPLLNLH